MSRSMIKEFVKGIWQFAKFLFFCLNWDGLAEKERASQMTVEGSQIAQKAQIFSSGSRRNERNKRNGHTDDTDSALMGVDEKKVVVKPNYYF